MKFTESNWNPFWVIALTSSSCTDYTLNEHKDFDQYDLFEMPSDIMPCYNYPESLVNQNEMPISLWCQQVHLAQIMSLTSMKILTNMAHLLYDLR